MKEVATRKPTTCKLTVYLPFLSQTFNTSCKIKFKEKKKIKFKEFLLVTSSIIGIANRLFITLIQDKRPQKTGLVHASQKLK